MIVSVFLDPDDLRFTQDHPIADDGGIGEGIYVDKISIDCQSFAFLPRGGQAMTDITQGASTIGFLDNPHAPDVFADSASGFFNFNGNIRITFESLRVNHISTPGPVTRVVIGRLVMPLAAAEAMARAVLDFINKQRTQQNPPDQAATRH